MDDGLIKSLHHGAVALSVADRAPAEGARCGR
jgi:hypothetical protein